MIGECFIATSDGPVPVADLQPGDLLFSWNSKYTFVELGDIYHLSGDLYRSIYDNGMIIHTTKDQEILMRGGTYKKLESIDLMSSVMPFTRTIRGREWSITMYDELNTRMPEHLFVAAYMGLVGDHIHHINGDHMDNRPCNLIGLSEQEHRKIHDQWKREKIVKINDEIKNKAVSVRAESWRQWYYQLSQEDKDLYWEKLRQGSMRSARSRVTNGSHNFVVNNPMNDPEKVILMKKSKVATTAYKLKDQGLPISESAWDESVRCSGLYKSHCFRSDYIKSLFGDWSEFVAYLDAHNSKMIHTEFDYVGKSFSLQIPNFVICNKEMTRGIVVKGV